MRNKLTAEQRAEVTALLQDTQALGAKYVAGDLDRDTYFATVVANHTKVDAIKGTKCKCLACREVAK